MQTAVENPYNPLASIVVLIASFTFGITPYLLAAGAYRTFNTEKWHPENASLSIMLFFVLAVFGASFYLIRERNVDIKGWVQRHINLDELTGKPYLDYLLAHYGYVASAATFCAAIVYVAKWLLPILGVTAISLFMSVTVCFVFMVYGLVFAKAVWGARLRSAPAIAMLLPMVFLDVALMQMAIQGASSLYPQQKEAKECLCEKH